VRPTSRAGFWFFRHSAYFWFFRNFAKIAGVFHVEHTSPWLP